MDGAMTATDLGARDRTSQRRASKTTEQNLESERMAYITGFTCIGIDEEPCGSVLRTGAKGSHG